MAKLKSTFLNMTLSLTCIALVAAAALAGVYLLTQENIKAQKIAKQAAAISAVLPSHDRIADPETVQGLVVHKAYTGDTFAGAAVETESNGFGGKIRLMVGFDNDSHITGYEVLEQGETPGLGTHIVEWFKNADKAGQNIIGRKADGAMTVSKDGGDVDAITAATISSRAFLEAVNKAYSAYTEGEVQAASGASQQAEPKVSEDGAAATCECGKPVEECCKTKGAACEGQCGNCQHEGEHPCKH
ncbi:MAG: RnfABCDGE type electron transport complex subunit G [Paludibacteraceae bacterium]